MNIWHILELPNRYIIELNIYLTEYKPIKFFSVAIKDCWASTVENIRDADGNNADDDTGGLTFNVAGGGAQTVRFYEAMCPKYNWVVSSFDDHTQVVANPAIILQQFMFNGDSGGEFFYHCEVYKLYTVYLNTYLFYLLN